jgi:hypothetical protein
VPISAVSMRNNVHVKSPALVDLRQRLRAVCPGTFRPSTFAVFQLDEIDEDVVYRQRRMQYGFATSPT